MKSKNNIRIKTQKRMVSLMICSMLVCISTAGIGHCERIKDIVKKHGKKLGNGRCAFVVKDALGFGIARMYELIGGEGIHIEVGVFYSLNEAAEWLKH